MIKVYRVNGLDSEVDAISLVEYPAIESDFIYLARQRQNLSYQEERRMLYGPVLIPGKPIYRVNEFTGEEYYIEFSEKAIEQLSRNFMENARNRNWTTDHVETTDRLSVVETWIKYSEEDKSVALGFEEPLGTWFVGVHVDSNEIWEKVKSGEFKGFSVEAFLALDEINKLSDMKMNDFFNKFKELLSEYLSTTDLQKAEPKEEEVTEEQVELQEDEKVQEEPVQEEQHVEDEEQIDIQLEETPEAEEAAEEEQVEEEPQEEEVPEPEKKDEEKEALEATIRDLEAKIDELQKANEKLSRTPSAEPLNVKGNKNGGNYRDMLEAIANRMK